jgi:hypothetical protein
MLGPAAGEHQQRNDIKDPHIDRVPRAAERENPPKVEIFLHQ